MTTNTEAKYIAEKFEDIELLENFEPLLNKNGQCKLAFVQAVPQIVERDEQELSKLQFRFVCEGKRESRVITYTGWLKSAMTENSKLGKVLKAFNVIEFPKTEVETVEEFDFEAEFKESAENSTVKFDDLMDKLNDLEGVVLLAKLEKNKGIWHTPDPTTFEFPKKDSEYYRTNVEAFKQ